MKTLIRMTCCAMLIALPVHHAVAQRVGDGDGAGRRMQGGGINYAPQPDVYSVISVDSYARTVQMRAADGRTGDVYVAEGVYDLSTLKAGDKIRVDFVVPDAMNSRLSAASVWPVK
jgi:hypothetical protein